MADTKKRTVMESLKIKELSGVDYPAQEGASVVIMKRHEPETVEKTMAAEFDQPMMTTIVEGHQHVFDANARAGGTTWDASEGEIESHRHHTVRLENGSMVIGLADGHTHEPAPLGKNESANGGGHTTDKESEMSKDTTKTAADGDAVTKDQLDEANARAERAEKMAELTDEQKTHFGGLEKSAQESFLKLSPEGRQTEVEGARAEDPVVYKDRGGNEYRKSDDQRVVEAVKRADKAEKRANDERELRLDTELSKRADVLKNVKGTPEVKKALLKAIDGIEDENLRKGAHEIVTAANSGMASVFKRAGTEEGGPDVDDGDAEGRLENLAKKFAKDNDVTIERARADVLFTEEGYELSQAITG